MPPITVRNFKIAGHKCSIDHSNNSTALTLEKNVPILLYFNKNFPIITALQKQIKSISKHTCLKSSMMNMFHKQRPFGAAIAASSYRFFTLLAGVTLATSETRDQGTNSCLEHGDEPILCLLFMHAYNAYRIKVIPRYTLLPNGLFSEVKGLHY